jgi:hypothetical protein
MPDALQTAPLNVCHYTPRGSVFARLAYEHFLASPSIIEFSIGPLITD